VVIGISGDTGQDLAILADLLTCPLKPDRWRLVTRWDG
jgi:hypothetical protein